MPQHSQGGKRPALGLSVLASSDSAALSVSVPLPTVSRLSTAVYLAPNHPHRFRRVPMNEVGF